MSVLEVQDLVKQYRLRDGRHSRVLTAVNQVNFSIETGRTVALVGQSGSGKSTLAKLLMQLEKPTSGRIVLDGRPVVRHGAGLKQYRSDVQMVFQDPFASLNPYHTIAHHLGRPLILHGKASGREEVMAGVHRLLERVRLEPDMAGRKPHELSGGQRQRIAIARALAPEPRILVADEPVSMLDVSIRLGVLNLLADLQREENLGVFYITHDLATARHFSDDILVMFKGEIVERGAADDVILNPQHEYTQLLAEAAPNPEKRLSA